MEVAHASGERNAGRHTKWQDAAPTWRKKTIGSNVAIRKKTFTSLRTCRLTGMSLVDCTPHANRLQCIKQGVPKQATVYTNSGTTMWQWVSYGWGAERLNPSVRSKDVEGPARYFCQLRTVQLALRAPSLPLYLRPPLIKQAELLSQMRHMAACVLGVILLAIG